MIVGHAGLSRPGTGDRNGLPLRARPRVTFDIFKADVIWDGRAYPVDVDAAETVPLVGMGLLEDQELCIQVFFGGSVSIRELPVS